jgi:hypothetical protein
MRIHARLELEVYKGDDMTEAQRMTVDALVKLGSRREGVVESGSQVLVPLPFRYDVHPNIVVWPDGSWHDFSADIGWERLGMKYYGDAKSLTGKQYERWEYTWSGLLPVANVPEAKAYCEKRCLYSRDLRVSMDGPMAICFPLYDPKELRLVGIQRRYIDGIEPKNKAFPGSDMKGGIFARVSKERTTPFTVSVFEGATDTYTDIWGTDISIGAPSCSSLGGVKSFIEENKVDISTLLLSFDNDIPGQKASMDMQSWAKNQGIKCEVLLHKQGYKDVNDLICAGIALEYADVPERENGFVKVVDEITPDMESATWVGFYPPDFPQFRHISFSESAMDESILYVFPESFGRSRVNEIAWERGASAYILRGW